MTRANCRARANSYHGVERYPGSSGGHAPGANHNSEPEGAATGLAATSHGPETKPVRSRPAAGAPQLRVYTQFSHLRRLHERSSRTRAKTNAGPAPATAAGAPLCRQKRASGARCRAASDRGVARSQRRPRAGCCPPEAAIRSQRPPVPAPPLRQAPRDMAAPGVSERGSGDLAKSAAWRRNRRWDPRVGSSGRVDQRGRRLVRRAVRAARRACLRASS